MKVVMNPKDADRERPFAILAASTATAVVGAAALYYYTQRRARTTQDQDTVDVMDLPYPPGPKGWPWIGNLLPGKIFGLFGPGDVDDRQRPDEIQEDWFIRMQIKYGKVFSMYFPFLLGRVIFIADPILTKRILVTKNYPKTWTYQILGPLLGSQSIVSLPGGPTWAHKRKAFQPGFLPAFLKQMVGTMSTKLERFVSCIEHDIEQGAVTNMLQRSQTFTSDVIVSIAFGEDWGGGDQPHAARMWETEIARLTAIMFNAHPIREFIDFPTFYKIRKYEKLIDQEMRNILERRLAVMSSQQQQQQKGSKDGGFQDICSLAIAEMQRDNKEDGTSQELSEDDKISITHQLKTFYFAGHDTTATTIAWCIWELSQHPEILTKVRNEVQQQHKLWTTTTDDATLTPTYEQLQQCEYLDAVLKETLRLYPPANGLSRVCIAPTETYNGYRIGDGAFVIPLVYSIHRHPDNWKNDPNQFIPERFLDGSEGTDAEINDKWVPFSRGPRDCIGKVFAMLEAKLCVSRLVTLYDFECINPKEQIVNQITNIPKDGAKIRFQHRSL